MCLTKGENLKKSSFSSVIPLFRRTGTRGMQHQAAWSLSIILFLSTTRSTQIPPALHVPFPRAFLSTTGQCPGNAAGEKSHLGCIPFSGRERREPQDTRIPKPPCSQHAIPWDELTPCQCHQTPVTVPGCTCDGKHPSKPCAAKSPKALGILNGEGRRMTNRGIPSSPETRSGQTSLPKMHLLSQPELLEEVIKAAFPTVPRGN